MGTLLRLIAEALRHCRLGWQEDAILGELGGLVPVHPFPVHDNGGRRFQLLVICGASNVGMAIAMDV
jgi:hypothetical protein